MPTKDGIQFALAPQEADLGSGHIRRPRRHLDFREFAKLRRVGMIPGAFVSIKNIHYRRDRLTGPDSRSLLGTGPNAN